MESSSASEGASPDVRPVICESLLDLSDWGDLLVEQSSQASSAEEHSDSRSSPSVEIVGQGAINLPIRTQQTDPSVLQTNGTTVRARKRIRHSWPDVSVKLGQDVTYNCFPHEHFSFAFKEVLFREEKIQEDDDDDDLPEVSLVPSPEPTFPTKKEKSSHNKLSKTVKILHSRKSDKKTSVLTEQQGKNTLVSPHNHGEDRRDKRKEGRSSPLITMGVSALKKPGVIKERNIVPIVHSGAHIAKSQTPIAGSRGPTVRTPVTIVQPGVQTPSTKSSPQQSSGVSNVVHISNTPQDGRSTPTHSNLVTVLPPTPPNEPVVLQQPLPQVVSQVPPKVVPKVSQAQLTAQPMQFVLKHVKAQPSKSQGVTPLSSPTIQVMKVSQVLTPPIDNQVATISSPPVKQEQLLLKQNEPPADKPSEKPHEKPSVASTEKDTNSTVSSLEGSSSVTGIPLEVARDNNVNVIEDEEEVDVVETLEPPRDETDSQVEVTQSKVELSEDTKEVLSSLKRKSPSSPCSTLLKIKCEKIDAVVRINKTNEDLYRAEGSQEKRSVQARRNSRSAAEEGCFFNVVDKSSRLGVCPCGRANSYDAMIACDNPKCEVEWYHFTCVGVTKVPKDEWFCPFCSKETAEALQRKEERRKELQRKKKVEEDKKRKKMKRVPQEEAGLCPCGQPNSWDRMIACDGRDCSVEWYHFRCVDVKSAPDEEWLCILCRDTVQEPRSSPYVRRKRRYLPIKYTIYGDSGEGSTDDTKEWKEDQSSDDTSDSNDTSDDDDEEDVRPGKGDDARSQARERARNKWRAALSEEVDVDGDSNQSSSDDDDDELSRSKRSRRKRHKKIDLDYEDGAEFDEDMGGRGDEITRTKITPKRRRSSSGEKRSRTSTIKPNESLDKGKDASKMESSGSSDQSTKVLSKQQIVNTEGRFLIHQCSSCGQEFVIPPTEDGDPSNQDSSDTSILCHMCVTKGKKKGEKSAPNASVLPQPKTKDTTDLSAGGGDAPSSTDSSESGIGKKDGEAQGSRSTRFHEIVACKVCGMGYRTRVSLLIHMKDKHQGHLGCFECTPCDRLFISQEECDQHMASFHHA